MPPSRVSHPGTRPTSEDNAPHPAGSRQRSTAETQRGHRHVRSGHQFEPVGYHCPFCRIQRGEHNERNQPTDVVAVTDLAYARISPKWWPNNPGAALVIPRAHVENLYDTPNDIGHAVWDLTKTVARAMRESYDCDGISTRQHNEPHGNQDVWHLHVHVFPRYADDQLYARHAESA